MTDDSPRVLYVDRAGPIVDGIVESRSRSQKQHFAKVGIVLKLMSTPLCGCESSYLGGRVCPHVRALLMSFDKEELVEAILDGAEDPDSQ